MNETCDQAIEILSATHDGEDLTPEHLKLIENAVNGFLNEKGKEAFADLYKEAAGGNYKKPWLQGVEHLTRDLEGYVYWKGSNIEHWSGKLPYSEEGREAAKKLSERCKALEGLGVVINTSTVTWHYEDLTDGTEQAKELAKEFNRKAKEAA